MTFIDPFFIFYWEVLLQAIHTDLDDVDDSLRFCGWDLRTCRYPRVIQLGYFLLDHHEGCHCDGFGDLAVTLVELNLCLVDFLVNYQ